MRPSAAGIQLNGDPKGNYSPQTRRHVALPEEFTSAEHGLVGPSCGRPRQGRQSRDGQQSALLPEGGQRRRGACRNLRVAFKLLAQRRKAGPAERGHDHRRSKLWIGRDTKAEVPHCGFAGGQHDLGQRLATRLAVNKDLARASLNDGAAERGGSELRLAKATERRLQLRQPYRLRLSLSLIHI